ncbi:sigma-70 family RNA polymerase sigma factor [uncultured Clostridium sp.]|uniref:sigma-70 family RNA polymerase sigma factor n=1 Tax=uncultured Clostridium sp. TaxID=59620 RepID=UPI00262A6460|nr:sigma-70 family RNA polymerase sigma factor [uncultured Clostridium sp.]
MSEIYLEKDIFLSKEERAIRGEKEAFVELINDNRVILYKIAKGILRDEFKAEDAVANAVLKSFKNINRLRNGQYFKTWLTRILINECNLILKKDKKFILFKEKEVEESYLDTYEEIDLIQAINSLRKEFREVTVLYYFQEFTMKEISEVLKVNEGTVKTRLHRARKKLSEILK